MLTVGAAAIIIFSIALASLLARSISKPVLTLKADALALIDGQPLVTSKSKVAELREVERALRYANAIAEERRTLQEQLLNDQERLTQAVAVGGLGVFHHDHRKNELEFSLALHNMFGLTEHEPILMDTWLDRLHPEDRAPIVERVAIAHDPTGDGHYNVEFRVVHPIRGVQWLHVRSRTFFEGEHGDREAVRTVGAALDITQRKQAEEHQRFLMHELSHRSKNLLTVIQSIARQTTGSTSSIAEFQAKFSDRLRAIAIAQNLLLSESWIGVPLGALLQSQLEPFGSIEASQLECAGPNISLTPAAAQAIGLALHELATNAIKYGALSEPAGKLTVASAFEGDKQERFRLSWREGGGPPVQAPKPKALGMSIKDMVAYSLGGEVVLDFARDGLSWTLSCPHKILQTDKGDNLS